MNIGWSYYFFPLHLKTFRRPHQLCISKLPGFIYSFFPPVAKEAFLQSAASKCRYGTAPAQHAAVGARLRWTRIEGGGDTSRHKRVTDSCLSPVPRETASDTALRCVISNEKLSNLQRVLCCQSKKK